MKTLLERTKIPRKLKGKLISTPEGEYLCVSLHPGGITLQDSNGKVKGIPWRDICDFKKVSK